jgi:AraC-like DNA-binding protein
MDSELIIIFKPAGDDKNLMNGPMSQFLDFLTIAEFSQVILLIFILLVMDKNRKSNTFFAAFLFVFSLNFFSFFLFRLEIKILSFILAAVSLPGISIAGVLIYFYALSITGLLEKFRLRQLIHFIIYFASLIFFIIIVDNIDGVPHKSPSFHKALFTMISIGLINSISYIVYTMIVLQKYNKKIANYYSDLERMSLSWLMKITSLSFIALTLWCVTFWFSHLGLIPKSPAGIAMNLIFLIVIIFITAYHLINQPEIFRKNIEMEHAVDKTGDSAVNAKYARQSIDEKMQEEYFDILNSFMAEKKPYLDENITIKDLAEEIKIPPHHLSIVINNLLNKNFYTFINEYRIKEAVSILDDPENSDASIIAIAFRSGFNSKSTFNSVFKKITGQTPSEYRNRKTSASKLAS